MRGSLSYSVAVFCSLVLHAALVGALFVDWQPESKRVIMQPQYIEAKLVALAPKKKTPAPKLNAKPKAAPKKPKVDLAKKKRDEKKRLAKIAEQKKAEKTSRRGAFNQGGARAQRAAAARRAASPATGS